MRFVAMLAGGLLGVFPGLLLIALGQLVSGDADEMMLFGMGGVGLMTVGLVIGGTWGWRNHDWFSTHMVVSGALLALTTCIAGWVVFVVSFVVPAVETKGIFGGVEPGVAAFVYAITGWGESIYWGVSGLTNFYLLWSVRILWSSRPSMGSGVVLIGMGIFNLGWLFDQTGLVSREQLLVGYYLWLVSFLVVGVAFIWIDLITRLRPVE